MVITEAIRMDDSAMNNHRPITSRVNKAPVYTRDKRDKFTQRENKKWVRLATVVGYLISVCIPAISLTVYYVGFWDPQYKIRIRNDSAIVQKASEAVNPLFTPTDINKRDTRNQENILKCPTCECGKTDESEKIQPSLNSLLTGRYYSASSPEDAAPTVVEIDDYQTSLGSREKGITSGHGLEKGENRNLS